MRQRGAANESTISAKAIAAIELKNTVAFFYSAAYSTALRDNMRT